MVSKRGCVGQLRGREYPSRRLVSSADCFGLISILNVENIIKLSDY